MASPLANSLPNPPMQHTSTEAESRSARGDADANRTPVAGGAGTKRLIDHLSAGALPIGTLLIAAFFAIKTPVFLTLDNWISISVQVASLMTISIPFAVLLMAGKVDLSVGSLLGFSGVVAGLTFPSLGPLGAPALALGVGLLVGMFNGFLVSWLSMSPIIVAEGKLRWLNTKGSAGVGSYPHRPSSAVSTHSEPCRRATSTANHAARLATPAPAVVPCACCCRSGSTSASTRCRARPTWRTQRW